MKNLIVLLTLCALPMAGLAQLPLPVLPDWLKPNQSEAQILNQTQVTLAGNNYNIIQKNIVARSRGFKILGLISIRSASYTEAMTRLYTKARVQEGHPQALANVVHERTSSNFILFTLPTIHIRADLVEFFGEDSEEPDTGSPTPVFLRGKKLSR
jgi:hypothetical protein